MQLTLMPFGSSTPTAPPNVSVIKANECCSFKRTLADVKAGQRNCQEQRKVMTKLWKMPKPELGNLPCEIMLCTRKPYTKCSTSTPLTARPDRCSTFNKGHEECLSVARLWLQQLGARRSDER